MPATAEKNLEKFQAVWKQITESITREEFVKAFEAIVVLIVKVEKNLIEKNSVAVGSLTKLAESLKGELKTGNNTDFSDFKKELTSTAQKLFEEQRAGLNFIHDKVRKIKEGKDGYTPIKGKDYFDGEKGLPGKDGNPDTPQQTRDKLE